MELNETRKVKLSKNESKIYLINLKYKGIHLYEQFNSKERGKSRQEMKQGNK